MDSEFEMLALRVHYKSIRCFWDTAPADFSLLGEFLEGVEQKRDKLVRT